MKKSLPHLASRNDEIAKEVLAFLCIMLFNANSQVQVSIHKNQACLVSKPRFVRSAGHGYNQINKTRLVRSLGPG